MKPRRHLVHVAGLHGPALQVALFEAGEQPSPEEVAAFADRARALLQG